MKKLLFILSTILLLTVLVIGMSLSTSAEVVGGECGEYGDNVTWSYDTSTLTLHISGSGKMTLSPWRDLYKKTIFKVVIENGVTSIAPDAFFGCDSMTSIAIPNSVTSIGSSAFADCDSLTNIQIPNSVSVIGYSAFYDCDNLTSIVIPDGVTAIETGTFDMCENLTSVVIPDSVTYIGSLAFSSCAKLTEVKIPYGVTTIEESVFYSCESLKSITIPNSVVTIKDAAFACCFDLTSVVIPNSVTSIGEYAFSSCVGLRTVEIADSVTTIGACAFSNCQNLTDVVLPEGLKIVESNLFSFCEKLKMVYIPRAVVLIKSDVFSNTSLQKIIYCGTETQWNEIVKTSNWNGGKYPPVFYHELGYHIEDEQTHAIRCNYCEYEEIVQHAWNAGAVTTPATHTSVGVMTYTCYDCKFTRTEQIEMIAQHSYDTIEIVDGDQHKKVCSCGSEIYYPHSWDNGEVTKKASDTATGIIEFSCKDCNAKFEQEIAIVHNHEYANIRHVASRHTSYCIYCNDSISEEYTYVRTPLHSPVYHRSECECGIVFYEDHLFQDDNDISCDLCGYVKTSSTGSTTEVSTYNKHLTSPQVVAGESSNTMYGCESVVHLSGGIFLLVACGAGILMKKKKD